MQPAPESSPDTVDCAAAIEAIHRFVAGSDLRNERTRLRAHVSQCASCRSYYRQFIEAAARLSRGSRTNDEDAVTNNDDQRDRLPPARRVSLLSPVQRRKPSKLTKGVLLIFGVLACFAIVRPDRASAKVKLESLGGDVRVGTEQVARAQSGVEVARGTACSTGAQSQARLRSGESTALLHPATAVILEDGSSLRLQLLVGQLELDGSAVIVTPMGVVEFDEALGSVFAQGDALSVRALRGAIRVSDATGVCALTPGEEKQLSRAGSGSEERAH